MPVPDKRIGSRSNRLSLENVYGKDPFDALQNTGKQLVSLVEGLSDKRISLAKVVTDLKRLSSPFDINKVKDRLLTDLGVKAFHRNLQLVRTELPALVEKFGKLSNAFIKRVDSLGTTASYPYTAGVAELFGQVTAPNSVQSPYIGNTGEVGSAVGEVIPSVEGSSSTSTASNASCQLPSFAKDTQLAELLGVSIAHDLTAIALTKPKSVVTTMNSNISPTEEPHSVLDTVVVLALLAIALDDYVSLSKLPPSLQQLVAELLVAYGLDQEDAKLVAEGLILGNLTDLLDLYPDALDGVVQLLPEHTDLANALNAAQINPVLLPPKLTLNELLAVTNSLPPPELTTITPITTVLQAVSAVGELVTLPTQRRYYRTRFIHSYHPRTLSN